MRSTFEDALEYFEDGSVDLLHIDGRHFYDDVKHDFTIWRRKLTEDAVVLLHDTNVRERSFGVWKFFQEMAERHPSFQFYHGHGLGVLAPGERIPEPLAPLLQASSEPADQIRTVYAALGGALTHHAGVEDLRAEIEQRAATEAALRADIEQRAATEAALRADIEQRAASEAVLRAEVEQRAVTEAALRADIEQRAVTEAEFELARNNIAKAEQRQREDYSAIAALQAEINSLRTELKQADQRGREGEAAAAARQAEITLLRSELAAARDVGKAALASLRTPPAPILEAPQNAGWLRAVLRRFGLSANYPLPSAS
jgi:hypothetical protein